ncbi:hypothetical protein PHYSODRAFT_285443 [Phytophthora sojae]|uniref:Crinkler effector protein N-terminal domain-containing protein n=1 Tax=Phytophthora sojae (strain P6497) TaxID=1094619 RepID=G4Z9X2_PHYSP|nr:hypothetical protein PHYSODRAFT_285443 [Phytophthora sojae]EGZ20521.1 hypothetical protein PHYSODRAFT_285443 [Phytophthora sojae]|eukprot:XP_009523238.1 hypothetical protein PHYSODRAFT_285443 [Phytophthora sojae]
MVKLFCAIVGAAGSAFEVDIDEGASVSALKKAIKAESDGLIRAEDPWTKLQLFLAKTADGAWLDGAGAASVALDERGYPQGFGQMDPTLWIKNPKHFGDNFQPGEGQVHVLVKVPEQEHAQTGLWLVTGSVDNALITKGIRCKLYWMATLRIGYYDPTRCIGNKNVAFWYEDKKLCFHVLFETKDAALLFETDLRTGPQTLGSPLTNQVVETRVAPANAVSTDLQRVFYCDYVPDDSESPQNTVSSISLTTSVSNLDSSTDEFRFQRIEDAKFFLPYGKAESCHLVSRKQSRDHKREFAKYDRDSNNRLALSREMHGWFDGMSIEVPIVNMLPGSVEENQSIGNRRKVEVFVKVLDAQCTDRVFSRLKGGSTTTDDPLMMKTFVHVEDPETFCLCMRWKHDDNAERWRSFWDMTPAVD